MLLRRVIEHVKTQNWTAVTLDFVIVVMGVFIGIQVANWNDTKADRRLEKKLLVRLYEETKELRNLREDTATLPRERKEILKGVQISLLDSEKPLSFSGAECKAIQFSHILRRPPDTLPTLEEMVANGRIGIIGNSKIRQQLTYYIQARERARYFYDELVTDVFRLTHLYPQYFGREATLLESPNENGFDRFANDRLSGEFKVLSLCYSDGMKDDAAFLNDVEDNYARINAYLNEVIDSLNREVSKLEEALVIGLNLEPTGDEKNDAPAPRR